MAGSIRVAGHTIAEHDIVNDKVDVKNATLGSSVRFPTFVGLILPFAYDTSGSPPTGFFECDGSAISRTTYADLFSAIGTTWGVGDGSTTFNLPDLQGAFLRGTGTHGTSFTANSSGFAGPSVGSFENDQMQGHKHNTTFDTRSSVGTDVSRFANGAPTTFIGYTAPSTSPVTDSTNGTPRVGNETRPFNAGVMYCIKY